MCCDFLWTYLSHIGSTSLLWKIRLNNSSFCLLDTQTQALRSWHCFITPQGKTHTLKPGTKEPVPAMVRGPPSQPMEDISMRIYLFEGLLGKWCSLVFSAFSFMLGSNSCVKVTFPARVPEKCWKLLGFSLLTLTLLSVFITIKWI